MKRALFLAIVLGLPALFLIALAADLLPKIQVGMRSGLMQYLASNLPDSVRNAMHEQIILGPSFWEAVPDPDIAGLAQRNRTVRHTGAEVRINNAGLRAARAYSAKRDSVFRIVCLGDSFVFGMGGREEDRFCDQLGAFYRENDISVGGRAVEAYAVGLPGWTLVQETTYLASRITSYDPDLIIVLSAPNDITDNFGVTGVGGVTADFSPELRELGSAVSSNEINVQFGDTRAGERSALAWDLSPDSRRRWDKAMQRLKRLADLQHARGKHILISALVWGWKTEKPDAYAALFQLHLNRVQISAPFAMTSFRLSPKTTLAHDSHPSRAGHGMLRDQLVNVLHRLGWITIPETRLRALSQSPVWLNPAPDAAPYEAFTQRYVGALSETLDFTNLRPEHTRAFLGGVFPEIQDPARALEEAPWASLRSAFLLRRPRDRTLEGVEVEIEIPSRPELFPFSLRILLDGDAAGEMTAQHPNESGRYRVSGAARGRPFNDAVVEVSLETKSYFSTIDDARMKSYRLLRARAY